MGTGRKSTMLSVIWENYRFFVGRVWEISRSRVLCHLGLSALRALSEYLGGVWLLREIVEMLAVPQAPFSDYVVLVGGVLLVQLAHALYRSWYSSVGGKIFGERVIAGLREEMFQKATAMDYGSYEDTEFYDRFQRAGKDLGKLVDQVMSNLSQFVSCFLTMGAVLVLLTESDPGTLCFLICPLIAVKFFEKSGTLFYERRREMTTPQRRGEAIRRVIFSREAAMDIRTTRLFSVLQMQMEQALGQLQQITRKFAKPIARYNTWGNFFYVDLPMIGGILYAMVRLVVTKSIGIADFSVLASAVVSVCTRLSKILTATQTAHRFALQIQDYREFIQRPITIRSGFRSCERIDSIEFRHVSFVYPNGKQALNDCCITLKRGESAALVGLNGAGKSTLIKLLLRFYDPSEGEILVNGYPLPEYRLKPYRDAFACALQECPLFSLPIVNNVGDGPVDDSDAPVLQQALIQAGIWPRISPLPMGMYTPLGKVFSQEGVELSGGQRQKLAIARVIAKCLRQQASGLILDEPTSALDPEAEYEAFHTLMDAGGDKVMLFITHRLSSTIHAKVIYLLQDGHVIESGSHQQLMQRGGVYAQLFLVQANHYREGR